MRTRGDRGFTLIELMVVIVVVGMLMALLLPAILKSRGVADLTRCVSNLRQIGTAFSTYSSNNEDMLPPISVDSLKYGQKEWMDLIRPEMDMGTLDDKKQLLDLYQTGVWRKYAVFDCPGNGQKQRGSGRFDYGYNRNCVENDAGRNINTIRGTDMILVHCANHYAPNPVNGRNANPGIHENGFDNYLFGDGHVENSNAHYKRASNKKPWLATWQ